MPASQTNPFEYGGVVGPDAFCNRTRERDDLARAAENGDRLFVYAERRMGKTSLVRLVLDALDPDRFLPVYVDLWPTDGTDAFVEATARALAAAAATRADKLLEASRSLFSRLNPTLALDEAGNPSLQFGGPATEKAQSLEEVLAAPPRVAEKRGRRVVLVFDEFQQILAYESDHVERALRSAVQQYTGVATFFLGSRKHLIEQMFSDSRRPLYRSAGHYPLGPIAAEHWSPFIMERFEVAEKRITEGQVEALCALTEGHPFYTQHLCHALWERTPRGHAVAEGALEEALGVLLRRESYAFTTRWETLTRNQQRFLRGLSTDDPGAQPFSSAFVRAHGLRTPSNAQRAAESLLKLDVIDREGGAFTVTDRFFKLWVRATMGA